MLIKSDLILLKEHLIALKLTPYFSKNLNNYTDGLIAVIDYLLVDFDKIPSGISNQVCTIIWSAINYLRGSISTEIPYEAEYSLKKILPNWISENFVITTALQSSRDFHFYPLNPWKEIKIILPDFDYPYFDGLLIQIALPRLYKHKPIYYVALYHELGHFVDIHFNITESTFITNPVAPGTPPQILEMQKNYRREFFADLFAAAYVGEANYKLLNEIADNAPGSHSHPPTLNRVELARDFIDGNSNLIIDMFQNVLSLLKLPKLTKKYEAPDIKECFNNIRPYTIKNDLELHGILESSWNHLSDALKSTDSPWVHLDEAKIHCIINDLTEKSLRNYSIQESWSNGTSA